MSRRPTHGPACASAPARPALGVVLLAALLLAAVALAPAAARPAQAGARAATAPTGLSSTPELSPLERAAAVVLARDRDRFLARYADDPDRPFTTTFLSFRRELHASALFRALQAMPKGGLLHIHASGIGDAWWVVDRALTEPHSYVYWGADGDDFVHGELAVYPHDDPPAGLRLRHSATSSRCRTCARSCSTSSRSAPRTRPSRTSGPSSRTSSSAWTPSSRTGRCSSTTTAARSSRSRATVCSSWRSTRAWTG